MRFSRTYLFVLFAFGSMAKLHAQDMTQQITKGWKLDFVMYDIPIIPTERVSKAAIARFDSVYPNAKDVWWMQEPSDEVRPEIQKGYIYIAAFINDGNRMTLHTNYTGKRFYYFTSHGLANVPKELKAKFDSLYPGGTHMFWTLASNDYNVDFLQEDNSTCFNSVIFNKAGNIVYANVHHSVVADNKIDTEKLSP